MVLQKLTDEGREVVRLDEGCIGLLNHTEETVHTIVWLDLVRPKAAEHLLRDDGGVLPRGALPQFTDTCMERSTKKTGKATQVLGHRDEILVAHTRAVLLEGGVYFCTALRKCIAGYATAAAAAALSRHVKPGDLHARGGRRHGRRRGITVDTGRAGLRLSLRWSIGSPRRRSCRRRLGVFVRTGIGLGVLLARRRKLKRHRRFGPGAGRSDRRT